MTRAEFEEKNKSYWEAVGFAAGIAVEDIIGRDKLPAFELWIRAGGDRRINMWLEDPAEAGRAFLALRYERWR